MSLYMDLCLVVLFILLTPGVLLTLPGGASKIVTAITHGAIFAVLCYFTCNNVFRSMTRMEGFQANIEVGQPCELSDQCSSGYCKYKVCVATP